MMVENSNDGTNWIQLKHNINLNLNHFEPLESIIMCCLVIWTAQALEICDSVLWSHLAIETELVLESDYLVFDREYERMIFA